MTNLQYKYSNIDRVQHLSVPVMLLHGDQDIKIHVSHSRRLFLQATSTTALNETAAHHFGFNSKTAIFRPDEEATLGQNGTLICSYPVEWHVIRNVGHNEVYASREWLALLPSFVKRAESFAADYSGKC